MLKKNVFKIASLVLMLGLVIIPQFAFALEAEDLGLSYGAATGLTSTDIRTTVANIINVALGLLGILAVAIILVGGFKWMTALGNEDKVSESKKLIAAGVIGLVIIITAYAIAAFVINSLVNATA
ncbi:MAG: hypothetical protein WC310_01770 [Patescibacteria group bacterium]|jgi:hypothetical protein